MDVEEMQISEVVSMGVLESALQEMSLAYKKNSNAHEFDENDCNENEIFEYRAIPLNKLSEAISKMINALKFDISHAQAQRILANTLSNVSHYTTEEIPGHILFNAFADSLADENCGSYW